MAVEKCPGTPVTARGVAQAVRNAAPGTLPLVVLHQVGDRHDDDLVVLRPRDFCDWFGDLGYVPASGAGAIP
ncbi:MAG: hypothetical protein H5T59_10880 [Anaerolineae bacterium]|nr:hypothetical protein [Anaerolineae bacterium]